MTVHALLQTAFNFTDINGNKVRCKKGTQFLLDPVRNIGLFGNTHVQLTMNDYKVLYLN